MPDEVSAAGDQEGDDSTEHLIGSNAPVIFFGGDASSLGSFELTVPPNANVPPPHRHANNDEYVYVLDGVLRYTVDNVTRDLGPGDSMFTPRGGVHAFSNPHGITARALIVQTPDIGPQYFRDIGAVVNAGGPPDKAKLLDVMARYGLTLPG